MVLQQGGPERTSVLSGNLTMHRHVYQEAKPFPRLRSSLVTQARSEIPGLSHPLVFLPLFLQTVSPFSTSCTCLPQALPTRPSLKQLVCSWCQVKASFSQVTGSPFQIQFMPPRCERSPPPPPHTHTWASGVSSSLPRAQDILLSAQLRAFNFPSYKYVLLTWAGPLFPSGREARTARGDLWFQFSSRS